MAFEVQRSAAGAQGSSVRHPGSPVITHVLLAAPSEPKNTLIKPVLPKES
jgi:hypothetical protein